MKESLYSNDDSVIYRQTFNQYTKGRYNGNGLIVNQKITLENTLRVIFYMTGNIDLIAFDDTTDSNKRYEIQITQSFIIINGVSYGINVLELNKSHELVITSGSENNIYIDGQYETAHAGGFTVIPSRFAIGQSSYGVSGTINGYLDFIELYNSIKSSYTFENLFKKRIFPLKQDALKALSITINTSLGTGASFDIPMNSALSYGCVVDFGDGYITDITSYNDPRKYHKYIEHGIYEVKIYGNFTGFYFNNAGDKLKLLSINNFNDTYLFEGNDFYGCTNLEGILPDLSTLTTTLKSQIFRDCNKLTGDIIIPDNITNLVGTSGFYFCQSFNGTLYLSQNLTGGIGSGYFFRCQNLTGDLNIPEGVTTIGQTAFYLCGFNGTLNLPSTLTDIFFNAFLGTSNINLVNCYSITAPTVSTDGLDFGGTPRPLHVPVGATGYDVAPWTDTGIFSEIIFDL